MATQDHFNLILPTGRQAIVRHWNAAAADAVGDKTLINSGDAMLKAANLLLEQIDGDVPPNWNTDRKKAMQMMHAMLACDILHIAFMAAAHYHEGIYEGELQVDGRKHVATVPLLDEDGNPLEDFNPPPYPLKNETRHEWFETSPDGKEVPFEITLINGRVFASLQSTGGTNANQRLLARNPRWYREQQDMMVPYDPKTAPPNWVARAISKKVNEVDPLIQYMASVDIGGSIEQVPIVGQPDFLLQGFM